MNSTSQFAWLCPFATILTRCAGIVLVLLSWTGGLALCHAEDTSVAVKRQGPLAHVTRELYLSFPKPGQSYVIKDFYARPEGVERYQVRTTEVHNDVYQDAEIRRSSDNGKTWAEFRRYAERDITVKDGFAREPHLFAPVYDPVSKRMVRLNLLRTHKGDPRIAGYNELWDHTIWQMSTDEGRTWSAPQLLKYEEGADVSQTDWGQPEYLTHNRSYTGYNLLPLPGGGLATACSINTDITNAKGARETVGGVALFVGRWNTAEETYEWQPSNPVAVSRQVSDRGLFEGWVVELKNGDLFVDMRANRTKINPGRSFYAISTDGGRTLGSATELKYDDGTQFFRPSSLAMLLRHSVTGKLYWFGNICRFPDPVDGNRPRFPLVLAEVDEDLPALKRSTLTIIDDYDMKTQTPSIQYSNFSLVEDRVSHDFELYLTGWGEYKERHQGNVFRYLVRLKGTP